MTTAYVEFIATLAGLREEADRLPSVTGVISMQPRSSAHLRLNGLTVVAFAALEDFLKRRAYEIVSWLGGKGITFESFPKSLQQALLVGTIKGLSHSLDKTEKIDRELLIQVEALLLSQSGEKVGFIPSKYFFGHTTSNLSTGIVKDLLVAFGYKDGDKAINEIAKLLSAHHLGNVMEFFTNLAKRRHGSAHNFPADYRRSDFSEDVNFRIPLIAACVDTCLSQLALLVQRDNEEGKAHHFVESGFLDARALIRIAEYDPADKCWKEYLHGNIAKKSARNKFNIRVNGFTTGVLGPRNTVIIKNERGHVSQWIQPLR